MSPRWKHQALAFALIQMFSKSLWTAFPVLYSVLLSYHDVSKNSAAMAIFLAVTASCISGILALMTMRVYPSIPKSAIEAVGLIVIFCGINGGFYINHNVIFWITFISVLYGVGVGLVDSVDFSKNLQNLDSIHDQEAVSTAARCVGRSLAGIVFPVAFIVLYWETGLQATMLIFSGLTMNACVGVLYRFKENYGVIPTDEQLSVTFHHENNGTDYVALPQIQESQPDKFQAIKNNLDLSKIDTTAESHKVIQEEPSSLLEDTSQDVLTPLESFNLSQITPQKNFTHMTSSTNETFSSDVIDKTASPEAKETKIQSVPALPILINGKIPFGRQRSCEWEDLPSFRARTSSHIERFVPPLILEDNNNLQGTPITSTPIKHPVGKRRRLLTEPTSTTLVSNVTFDVSRSISLSLLESSKLEQPALQVTYHRRSVSSESLAVITPVPVSALIYTLFQSIQTLCRIPAFHLLLVSEVLIFFIYFIFTLTIMEWSAKVIVLTYERPLALLLFFLGQFLVSMSALQCYPFYSSSTSKPRRKLVLSFIVMGGLLLFNPYLHNYLLTFIFIVFCGMCSMLQKISLYCLVPLYIAISHHIAFRVVSLVFVGILSLGVPDFLEHYCDRDSLYQVSGLLCLLLAFLWLMAEPFFKKAVITKLQTIA